MKFTLSWLKKHLDTTASLDEISTRLTALGFEVEGIENPGEIYAPFTVCHIIEARQHPNADRLRVCDVETKFGRKQIVCGAPNARTGLKAVFAPEGSLIPATGMVLKPSTIRGVDSCGMMVSEREMGLSDEHAGIIEAPADALVGQPLNELLGLNDVVIEINLTPNRGDCAGVYGIARDLAASGLGTLKALPNPTVNSSFPSSLSVRVDDKTLCPFFIGRVIRGVKNGPSPKWLQDALKAIGLRPISALVDITNYFSFDLARPLHVFDLKKIHGSELIVRTAKEGETLLALNDQIYTLDPDMTVIADNQQVLALAGVMGGMESGCTIETTDVFLEVAQFDPMLIAKTGRTLSITSDARYRFERGIDAAAMVHYTDLATQMILELCGGEASQCVTAGAPPALKKCVPFNPEHVKTLGGVDVSVEEITGILTRLGFKIESTQAVVPSWRPDIVGSADLVEEVLRVKGYDCLPAIPLERTTIVATSVVSPFQRLYSQATRALAAQGLMECHNFSFISKAHAQAFGMSDPQFAVVNPISNDLAVMRPSLLTSLLAAAARNQTRGSTSLALCEAGAIFSAKETNLEQRTIATLRVGDATTRQVQKGERSVDAFDAKADALSVLEIFGLSSAQINTETPSYFHPGRSACYKIGQTVVACFGELHPNILKLFDLKGPVVGCEVYVEKIPLPKAKGHARTSLKLLPFQPISRDFAFIADEAVAAESLIKAIRNTERTIITDAHVFDEYRGKGMQEGKKSLALCVTLQPQEKTFTDSEIEAISQKIIAAVQKNTGAVLRSGENV